VPFLSGQSLIDPRTHTVMRSKLYPTLHCKPQVFYLPACLPLLLAFIWGPSGASSMSHPSLLHIILELQFYNSRNVRLLYSFSSPVRSPPASVLSLFFPPRTGLFFTFPANLETTFYCPNLASRRCFRDHLLRLPIPPLFVF